VTIRASLLNTVLALAGTVALATGVPQARAETMLPHIHGLSFSQDGKALLAAVHVGIAAYRDGRWSRGAGPAHDFMGFSAARTAIYSSGHPAPGSMLRNPLGLMKSTDGGASWRSLGLVGEADFHAMAVGYHTNAVYVINGAPNSAMPQPGLYYTTDDGASWARSEARGVDSRVLTIAVHPSDAATLALGTEGGLLVSRDHGSTFRRAQGGPVTAVVFTRDGRDLLYATYRGSALRALALDGGAARAAGSLPELGDDAVSFIAQNPANPAGIAIATYGRDVFLSHDGGRSWVRIAKQGGAP